jgi:hypothetical protein
VTRKITIEHSHKKVVAKHHHVAPALAKYQKDTMKRVSGRGPKQRPKGSLIGMWIGLACVLALMLAGGFYMLQRQSHIERLEKAALAEVKDNANATHEKIEGHARRVHGRVEPALELHRKAEADLVEVMEGGGIVEPTRRSDWMEKQGVSTPSPRTQRATRTEAPASPGDDDRDAIPGVMSRAEVVRRRQQSSGGGAPSRPTPRSDSSSSETASETYTKRTTSRMEPKIVSLARRVKLGAETIDRKSHSMREVQSSSLRFRSRVLGERHLTLAREKYGDLAELLETAEQIELEVEERFSELEEQGAAIVVIKEEEIAKREAKRALEEKAKRERDYQARMKTESQMAQQVRSEMVELLEKHQYGQALGSVRSQLGDYRTKEGRTEVQVLIDRYERLSRLKQFLIKQLQAAPMSFGWVQDGPPKDVVGADVTGIKTREKTTPWDKVTTPQILKFIKFYCDNNSVKRSERAEQYLAAAILFQEYGKGDLSTEFREEALVLASELRKDVNRLLE